jgi:hypothetical protein
VLPWAKTELSATLDHWDAKEDIMTTRSARLVAFLVPLLVLGFGVSLASSGPAIVADGIHPSSPLCLAGSSLLHRRTTLACSNQRIAQLHCYCCGKDENGHCNHQCCN